MPGFPRSVNDINYLDRMNLNHLPLPRKQHQGPSTFVVLQQPVSSWIAYTSGALSSPWMLIEERASMSFLGIFQLLGLLVWVVHFNLTHCYHHRGSEFTSESKNNWHCFNGETGRKCVTFQQILHLPWYIVKSLKKFGVFWLLFRVPALPHSDHMTWSKTLIFY